MITLKSSNLYILLDILFLFKPTTFTLIFFMQLSTHHKPTNSYPFYISGGKYEKHPNLKFNQKGALSPNNIVLGSKPGEDSVDGGEFHRFGRHHASQVGEDGQQASLSHKGRLSTHVGA